MKFNFIYFSCTSVDVNGVFTNYTPFCESGDDA